jgi:hypothetical protein
MAEPPPQSPPPAERRPLFRPAATTLFRLALASIALLAVTGGYAAFQYYHSPYWNRIGFAPAQPVLFSHRHHAGELRIDCRNCHATVETSAFAGLPTTHTCLACHSQVFTDTTLLRPVVRSASENRPLHWTRVTRLPDHVFFNHSIHLAKGVACTTCHGDVGDMALTATARPMTMRWCLDCHRDPGPRLQARDALLFAPRAHPRPADAAAGAALVRAYHIDRTHLTNCSTCHH